SMLTCRLPGRNPAREHGRARGGPRRTRPRVDRGRTAGAKGEVLLHRPQLPEPGGHHHDRRAAQDRKSVVEGKRVEVGDVRSRRRRTRSNRDWSSDVCSSDLPCSRAAFQAETRHVSMDEHGVDPDELDRALTEAERQGRKVKFFYTVPNFQNPAGITMTAERR